MSELLGNAELGLENNWDIMGSDELEPEQRDQVNSFRSALSECYTQGGVRVLDIMQQMHVIDQDDGKSVTQRLRVDTEKRIQRSGEALWVSPDYRWLQNAGLTKFNILRTARAETSAHKVFFGVLHEGDMDTVLPIAVKPCVRNSYTACEDWLNGELAAQNGERRFGSIGFTVLNNVGYSLTELDITADTLDTSNWQNVLIDENSVDFQAQVAMLGQIGSGLARLHKGGLDENGSKKMRIFHGDPQFKNIAVDITGEIFFIDWESASFYNYMPKATDVMHKIEHDLRVLFSSMARSEAKKGVGLLDIYYPNVQWELFEKHILNSYVETYLEDTEEVGLEFEYISEVEERLKQYILGGELYDNLSRARVQ